MRLLGQSCAGPDMGIASCVSGCVQEHGQRGLCSLALGTHTTYVKCISFSVDVIIPPILLYSVRLSDAYRWQGWGT